MRTLLTIAVVAIVLWLWFGGIPTILWLIISGGFVFLLTRGESGSSTFSSSSGDWRDSIDAGLQRQTDRADQERQRKRQEEQQSERRRYQKNLDALQRWAKCYVCGHTTGGPYVSPGSISGQNMNRGPSHTYWNTPGDMRICQKKPHWVCIDIKCGCIHRGICRKCAGG